MAKLIVYEYIEKRDSEQACRKLAQQCEKKARKPTKQIPIMAVIDSGPTGDLYPCFDYFEEHYADASVDYSQCPEYMKDKPGFGVYSDFFETPETKHLQVEPWED